MTEFSYDLALARHKVTSSPRWRYYGRVTEVIGLTVEAGGVRASMGEMCLIGQGDHQVEAEVVGFSGDKLYLFPLSKY